jgi:Dockerin type I domain
MFEMSLLNYLWTNNMLKSAFFLTTLFLFLFLDNLNATNYYISTASSGSGAGTSWTNELIYTSFDWSQVAGGDTVFFDGGSSGLTYNNIPYIQNVNPASQIVITKGKDAGHNGTVTFIPYDYTIGWAFQLNTCSNIKLTDLSFKCLLTEVTIETKILLFKSGNHNVVDNCTVESGGDGSGIVLYTEAQDTIENCTITIDDNNNPNIQDAIRFENGGAGGDVVIGNHITMNGSNPIPHKDILQTAGIGSSYNYQTIFANNFVSVRAPQADQTQGLFFADFVSGGSNRFLVYNNIFIMDAWKNNQPIIIQGNNGNSNQSLRVFNNTIVLGNSTTARFLMCGNIDTLIAKNNIISADSGIQFMYGLYNDASDYNNIPYKDIDYNQLWARDGIETKMYGGGYTYNFGGWKAIGYDAHSDTGMVSFVNKWGTNATDYKLVSGSAGVNTGVDLSNIIPAMDILGTTRPIGAAWDMGAFQYSSGVGGGGGTLPTSTLNLTALIEALYVAGGTAMPISPWVTVELHNSTAPYALVDSNSAALNPAGDGIFTFTKAVSGTNYYIVVKSMNTIETWSATAHIFTSGALSYDFTTAAAQAYESNMIQIGSKWCIYSGDVNQDGQIDSQDLALTDNDYTDYASGSGLVTDLNGDGLVNAADEQFINNNYTILIYRQTPAGAQ